MYTLLRSVSVLSSFRISGTVFYRHLHTITIDQPVQRNTSQWPPHLTKYSQSLDLSRRRKRYFEELPHDSLTFVKPGSGFRSWKFEINTELNHVDLPNSRTSRSWDLGPVTAAPSRRFQQQTRVTPPKPAVPAPDCPREHRSRQNEKIEVFREIKHMSWESCGLCTHTCHGELLESAHPPRLHICHPGCPAEAEDAGLKGFRALGKQDSFNTLEYQTKGQYYRMG
ncbi:hypothetical protein V8F20_003996 [Naviculisporaceae sp. PSN 640]